MSPTVKLLDKVNRGLAGERERESVECVERGKLMMLLLSSLPTEFFFYNGTVI